MRPLNDAERATAFDRWLKVTLGHTSFPKYTNQTLWSLADNFLTKVAKWPGVIPEQLVGWTRSLWAQKAAKTRKKKKSDGRKRAGR